MQLISLTLSPQSAPPGGFIFADVVVRADAGTPDQTGTFTVRLSGGQEISGSFTRDNPDGHFPTFVVGSTATGDQVAGSASLGTVTLEGPATVVGLDYTQRFRIQV